MIILDTNVVSEPLKPRGDPKIREWLDSQAIETLYLTTVNLAELLVGIEVLPPGKRRSGLTAGLESFLRELFEERILPFDQAAATSFSKLVGHCRSQGQTIGFADGQIAAIATTHGFTVATRDTQPFFAAGVAVINPWNYEDWASK